MKQFKSYLVMALQSLAGLALIFFCGDMAHDEFVRPAAERSLPIFVGCCVAVVFGALLVPGLGHEVEENGKRSFRLFSLGRRAYDGQAVVATEEPKP